MKSFWATFLSRKYSFLISDVLTRIPLDAPTEKKLCLTFDDGPTTEELPEILNILEEHEIQALFFLQGTNAQKNPSLVKELIARNHTLGNHSYSHVDLWKSSAREGIRELNQGTNILEDISGKSLHWMRPPYGRMTPWLIKWARKKKQQIMLWDTMPPDFDQNSTPNLLHKCMTTGIRPGSIICLHDNPVASKVTPELLKQALPELIDEGWTFEIPQNSF